MSNALVVEVLLTPDGRLGLKLGEGVDPVVALNMLLGGARIIAGQMQPANQQPQLVIPKMALPSKLS